MTLVDLAPRGFQLPVSTVLVTAATGQRAVASRNSLGPPDVPAVATTRTRVLEGISAVLVDGHHLSLATSVARGAERGIPVVADGGSEAGAGGPAGSRRRPRRVRRPPLPDGRPPGRPAGASVRGGSRARRAADPWRGWPRTGPPVRCRLRGVHVVDTLGAGDVLHGALLADIGRRGARDLPDSLVVAVDVATRSVAAAGAHGGRVGARTANVGPRPDQSPRWTTTSAGSRARCATGSTPCARSSPRAPPTRSSRWRTGMAGLQARRQAARLLRGPRQARGVLRHPERARGVRGGVLRLHAGQGVRAVPHAQPLPSDLVRRVVEFRVDAIRGNA